MCTRGYRRLGSVAVFDIAVDKHFADTAVVAVGMGFADKGLLVFATADMDFARIEVAGMDFVADTKLVVVVHTADMDSALVVVRYNLRLDFDRGLLDIATVDIDFVEVAVEHIVDMDCLLAHMHFDIAGFVVCHNMGKTLDH